MDATSFAGSLMIAHQRSQRSDSDGNVGGMFGSSVGSSGSYNGSATPTGSMPATPGSYFPNSNGQKDNSYDNKSKTGQTWKKYSPF